SLASTVSIVSPLPHPDLHVPEAGPLAAVPDVGGLARLALATVRRAQEPVAGGVADRITAAPELVRDAGVGRVAVKLSELAALDLPGGLRGELEVQSPVVDAPAPVRVQVEAVIGVRDDLLEGHARLGQQVDVCHADEGDPIPAVGTHAAAALAAKPGRGLAARLVAHEHAFLDERNGLRGDALVVPTE